jgi:(S)-sulfolactate dehydrogenase
MRAGAVLINTSRGGIIDEAAVVDALKSGRLSGAAIDVFAHEPLAAAPLFANVPNLLLTPHIAGITVESNWRVSEMIAQQITAFLQGNA